MCHKGGSRDLKSLLEALLRRLANGAILLQIGNGLATQPKGKPETLNKAGLGARAEPKSLIQIKVLVIQ